MPADLDRYLALNLRRRRVAQGLSQEAFAHRAGLHRTYVGGIERSEFSITLGTLAKLAHALSVDPCELIAKPPKGSSRAGLRPGRKRTQR